jgi:hypothetical protein
VLYHMTNENKTQTKKEHRWMGISLAEAACWVDSSADVTMWSSLLAASSLSILPALWACSMPDRKLLSFFTPINHWLITTRSQSSCQGLIKEYISLDKNSYIISGTNQSKCSPKIFTAT